MGKTRVVFDPGAKVNSSYYCNIVPKKGLLPDIRTINCRHYRLTLQQDGTLAHTSFRTTMDYLNKEYNFIEPHMGPPNSPDINPVDYAIWGALQQRVYCLCVKRECPIKSLFKVVCSLLVNVLGNGGSVETFG